MANEVPFQSREEILNSQIDGQLTKLIAAHSITVPPASADVTQAYIRKIEGTYNVNNAKKDTDSAIDLLYIAYNTTPASVGPVRVKISAIMDRLYNAQFDSNLAMHKAQLTCTQILKSLNTPLKRWNDARLCRDPKDIKGVMKIKKVVDPSLVTLAKDLQTKATDVKTELDRIATTYDSIILDTTAATSQSELALSVQMNDRAALQKEINESNAKRKQLDAVVADLRAAVAKYETAAKKYETRAETAEQRAFVMSILQVGAQVVAAALPAIAQVATASATGGASLVASAAASTVNRAIGDKNRNVKSEPVNDGKIAATRAQIATKTAQAKKSAEEIGELKDALERFSANILQAENPAAFPGKPESPAFVALLKQRQSAATSKLNAEQQSQAALAGALASLRDSVVALEKGLGSLVEREDNTGATLREMQMQMLDMVERYEGERRTQNAELVRISALLKGQKTREETISLAILSLNLSVSALKRTKEIIEEVAAFFKSFSAFVDEMLGDLKIDIDLFDDFVSDDDAEAGEYVFQNIKEGTDKFFVRSGAQWHAVEAVSGKFALCFSDGATKLRQLKGKYIFGPELEAYLTAASDRIDEIVAERTRASDQKRVDLDTYRRKTMGGAAA